MSKEIITKKEFDEFLNKFDKEPGEFTDDELVEIGSMFKRLPTSEKRWNDLVELLGVDKTGETFRQWVKGREYQNGTIAKNEHMLSGQTIDDITYPDFVNEVEKQKQDLYIQQVKTRDTWNAYRKTLRDEARIENLKDLMKECTSQLKALPDVKFEGMENECANEAVLLVSDLHIGAYIDNMYNHYNVEIARKRMKKLVRDTIDLCQRNKVQRLNVVNLGDMIAGSIHITARLEQQIDVIEQIMTASEILAETLVELQEAAPEVIYRSCTDNHSRAVANLKEHIEKENFGMLIDFYLKARLQGTGIIFANDNLDIEIGKIDLMNGKTAVFAHGHHDNINTIFQSMVSFTGQNIDMAFLGHYHSEKMKSFHAFKVYVNSSVMGTDSYAFSKRLFGKPAQTLIIFEGSNTINCSIDLDIQ